jgi:hypothetical protein
MRLQSGTLRCRKSEEESIPLLLAESRRSGFPKSTDFNVRSWGKRTFEGRDKVVWSKLSYFKRTRVGTVGTAQITPPATKQSTPLKMGWVPMPSLPDSILAGQVPA